jgi:NAD(P)-dependent dehydrogenase (short-subunit alcohol dehydrogenase family)
MSDFGGKVVLVTGGTSGIGEASAKAFAKHGAKVVVSGRREREGLAVAEAITAAGGAGHFVKADVAVEVEVKRLVAEAVAKFGRLDVVFANAGVESSGPVTEFDVAEYDKVFGANVKGVFLTLKYAVPELLKTKGVAVATSSVAGHIGMANNSVYIASKHAVEGIVKSVALEYAPQGLRVFAVAPAAIETAMFDRFAPGAEMRAGMASMHPMGRVGRADEVAAAVLFLASDAASFMTGHSLPVDGGWLAK